MTTTSPRSLNAVISVVVLGSIMSVLDVTVVNVALNRLSAEFDAPLASIQWVASAYTLALAAVIPVAAWAMGRFGTRQVYLTSIALFTAGSVLAGLAWNVETLIAFRVLQGLGGGMIMPVGMTMVMRAADPAKMGRTMGLLGIPILVGPLTGPILGGWLVDVASWRWIFFINLPIGLAVIALGKRFLPADGVKSARRLDVPGLLMLSPGLALLIYGLSTGAERSDFGSPTVLLAVAAGVVLVVSFVVRSLTAAEPLIDLKLFRERPFAVAAGTIGLFTMGYFGSMMLLPMYFQLVRGESASMSGLLGAPLGLAAALMMQVSGRLMDRVGAGWIIVTGITTAATGLTLVAVQISADTSYVTLGFSLFLMGLGVGMSMMPTMTSATRALRPEQIANASTMLNINSQVFASIGTALISLVLAGNLNDRVDGGLNEVHTLPDPQSVAPQLAEAFQHTYVWAIVLIAAAVLPALLISRRKPEVVAADEPKVLVEV